MSPLRKHWEPSPDDPLLLEHLRNTTLQLGISPFNVRGIEWSDTLPSGRHVDIVASDQPLFRFGQLVIAERMRGKLAAEDWRPLIASAVVYQKKMLSKLRLKVVEIIGVPFLLAIGVAFAVIVFTNIDQLAAIPSLGSLALIFFGLYRYTKYDREARLQADIETSKVLGKEGLIATLQKITGMGLTDVDARNETASKGAYPSTNDRINNLQSS